MSALTKNRSTSPTEKPQFKIGAAIAYLTLGVTTFLVVFPFWWMLVVASNEKNEIAKNPPRFTLGDQLPVTFDVIFQYANIYSCDYDLIHHLNLDGRFAYLLLHLCWIRICKVEVQGPEAVLCLHPSHHDGARPARNHSDVHTCDQTWME